MSSSQLLNPLKGRGASSRPLLVSEEISSQFVAKRQIPFCEDISEPLVAEEILTPAERLEIGEALISRGFGCVTLKRGLDGVDRQVIKSRFGAMGGRFLTCKAEESNVLYVCKCCGLPVIKAVACRVRGCPRCNALAFRRLESKFQGALSRMKSPSFLSLGYPNVPVLDRAALSYATKKFSLLRRSYCFSKVAGGFYDLDLTMNPTSKTFNVHVHSVIDSPFLNRDAVYGRWSELTSDKGGKTRSVYIERAYAFIDGEKVSWHPGLPSTVKNVILKACSGYLIKHATKSPCLPDVKTRVDFLTAAYHKRMLQGFGNMFKIPPPPKFKMTCPECEAQDFAFEGSVARLAAEGKRLIDRPLRSCKNSGGFE